NVVEVELGSVIGFAMARRFLPGSTPGDGLRFGTLALHEDDCRLDPFRIGILGQPSAAVLESLLKALQRTAQLARDHLPTLGVQRSRGSAVVGILAIKSTLLRGVQDVRDRLFKKPSDDCAFDN